MSGLVWPAFAKLGVVGLGNNLLRSAPWSQLGSDWIANNNPLPFRLIGRAPSPATSSPPTDIWPASTVRAFPSGAFTIAVASDSAVDSASLQTGAMQITVPYLDSNYTWHYAVYNLNGTTKVSATVSIDGVAGVGPVANALRILPFSFVSQSGTAAAPNTALQAGNLYVGNNTDAFSLGIPAAANMFDMLAIGDDRSHLGAITVPAGMALIILHSYIFNSAASAGTTPFFGKGFLSVAPWPGSLSSGGIWTPGAGPANPWQRQIFGAPASNAGLPDFDPNWPDVIPPQSEVRFQALAGAASAETSVIAECSLAPWPWSSNP